MGISSCSVRRRVVRALCAAASMFMMLRPAAAYDSPYWLGEYFANSSLAGAPASLEAVGAIAFDWGRGAPNASLPADGFSALLSRPM